jgi:hypothetical protein
MLGFGSDEGMIRGKLLFINGYVLEFREYVSIGVERPKYIVKALNNRTII